MAVSLILPWMLIHDTYNGQTSWGGYSPLVAFAYYPSQCASTASISTCGVEILFGFLVLQLPFFLAIL
jgi:hypothetical protein